MATAALGKAAISNISVQLIDLTPSDGAAPSFSWTSAEPGAGYVYFGPDDVSRSDFLTGAGRIGATLADGTVESVTALTGISSEAQTFAPGWDFGSKASLVRNFTLSPNTRVIFTSDATADSARGDGGSGLGMAWMSAVLGGSDRFSDQLYSNADNGGPASAQLFGQLRSGDEQLAGRFSLFTEVSAVSAVPEPGSVFMLIAGLAVVGALRWRRYAGRLAVLAGLGLSSGTVAAAGSVLSLGALQYTLTDLAPGDGIAPAIVFDLGTEPEILSSAAYVTDEFHTSEACCGVGVSLTNPYGSVAAHASLGGMELSALGSMYYSYAVGSVRRTFSLTPYTLIEFSHTGQYDVDLGAGDEGQIEAFFSGALDGPGTHSATQDAEQLYNVSGERDFTLESAMTSKGAPASGWIALGGVVNIRPASPISPVPEPGTWAMLLSGLAVVGAAWRRRGTL